MKNRNIIILGAGESGAGAAVLARKKGYDVLVSDNNGIKEKYKNVLSQFDIEFEEGKHSLDKILQAAEVIKSPGIPEHAPVVVAAREAGIPVISEIEFASRFTRAKLICITGSNGKTTTTLLTHHILHKAGLDVAVAGNVGKSFAMELASRDHDYFVLEISSFQLDGMFDFKADIAILLNITPDHLDRYGNSFQAYAESKFRILRNMRKEDAFIFCLDDPVIRERVMREKPIPRMFPFTLNDLPDGNGAYIRDNKIIINIQSKTDQMTLESLALQGKHNIYNSMAAAIGGRLLDLRKPHIQDCLSDFQNIEHRLEHVTSIHGVEFINDSKATNVNSSWYALESMKNNVIWIAGGIDKGNDYGMLRELVSEKVKAIVCLGQDNEKLKEAFSDIVENIVETKSMDVAVQSAVYLSGKGDTILLSPACASFDLFENYEDRGNQFKAAVNNL
ncbi:MAG TPA: UDP-N-acetylmuramoyl-L-alanine--D-glutamate ligase [Bacteroidales bacterium]|nr:UDP-N-acetylmuramoyl-L-alanine--D-glutamate ligase [Bacteroidales bacterium]